MPTTAARVNPKAGGARPQAGGAARPQAARRPAPKARVRRGSESENAAPNGQYTEGVYANRAAKAPAARKAPVAKPPGFKKIASPAPAPAPTRPKKRVAQAPAPAQRPKPVQAPAPARPKPKPIARPVKEAPAPRASPITTRSATTNSPITTKTTREVRLGRAIVVEPQNGPAVCSILLLHGFACDAKQCASSWKPRLRAMGDLGLKRATRVGSAAQAGYLGSVTLLLGPVMLGRSVATLSLAILHVSSVLEARPPAQRAAQDYGEVLAVINAEASAGWLGNALSAPVATSPADALSDGVVDTAGHLRAALEAQLDTLDAYSYDFSPAPSGAPSPVPTTTTETETCPDETFRYELALFAYAGNGWAGGTYRLEQLLDDGRELISEGTLAAGSYGVETFCLENGDYVVAFGGGEDPSSMGIQWLPEELQKITTCTGPCEDYATMIDGSVLEPSTPRAPPFETPAPTTQDARAATWKLLSVVVRGVPDDVFRAETTRRIVQHATRDVLPQVVVPEQVVGAEVALLERRRLQASDTRHRIDLAISMGEPHKTCSELGFASAQACLDSLVDSMNDAVASGEYKARLLYWAAFFNAGWPDDIGVEVLPNPPPEWVFAPTAAPTAADSGGSPSKRQTQGLVAALVVCAVLTILFCCFLWFRPKARRKDSWDVDMCWPMSSPSSGGPYSPEGSDDFDHLGERRQVDLGYLAAQYASPLRPELRPRADGSYDSGGRVSPGGTVSPANYSPGSLERDLGESSTTTSAERDARLLMSGGPARPDAIPIYAPTPTPRRRRPTSTPTPIALQKLCAPLEL